MPVSGQHFTNQLSVDALALCFSKTYNVSIFLIGPSSLFSLHRTSNCSMSPAYYFSCVHQSREELSNLNGNEKHETGRKVIGATFYVPISIFTATKRALWEYMNIHGYTILLNSPSILTCVGIKYRPGTVYLLSHTFSCYTAQALLVLQVADSCTIKTSLTAMDYSHVVWN